MLTQLRLQELIKYDPASGDFFWRVQRANRSDLVGKCAGYLHWTGYWNIMIDDKEYRAHRLAWLYVYGKFPKDQIDHINQNRSDNRILNLREATRAQNYANAKARKSRSGLKGAHWHERDQKWNSHCMRSGKRIWLGAFDTAEEAHAAYCKAARERYGEFFHSGIPALPPDASAV